MLDLPPAADMVVLSVNPKAGRASSQPRIDRLLTLLAAKGYSVEVFADLDQAASRRRVPRPRPAAGLDRRGRRRYGGSAGESHAAGAAPGYVAGGQ